MRLSLAALVGAAVLFVISLFLPVFITQNNDIYGYWVLAMGWLGFVTFQFAWYAAPFSLLALYVSRTSPQLGLFLSIMAIVMASAAFSFTDIPFGKNDPVLDYGLGFYSWYLSFYLLAFSILFRLVAWGSIEEELSANHDVLETSPGQKKELQRQAGAKAIRKIVPVLRKEKRVLLRQWKTAVPPPLPRKNIYGKSHTLNPPRLKRPRAVPQATEALHQDKVSPVACSPVLSTHSSKTSQPPPLPVDRKKSLLKVAPFLKAGK